MGMQLSFKLLVNNHFAMLVKNYFSFEVNAILNKAEFLTGVVQLKTATLTLVIVAVLIVALTSVDSALCYMLALILRRTP